MRREDQETRCQLPCPAQRIQRFSIMGKHCDVIPCESACEEFAALFRKSLPSAKITRETRRLPASSLPGSLRASLPPPCPAAQGICLNPCGSCIKLDMNRLIAGDPRKTPCKFPCDRETA
jgi:hypothetical protein